MLNKIMKKVKNNKNMLQEYYKTNEFLLYEKLNPKKVKSKIFPKEIHI